MKEGVGEARQEEGSRGEGQSQQQTPERSLRHIQTTSNQTKCLGGGGGDLSKSAAENSQ